MEKLSGVYVMRVASMLTKMHPQTLRKYERVGLLVPSRSGKLRMYSDGDIARLKVIKHLVEEVGLNLAGVRIALEVQERILNIRQELDQADTKKERLGELVDETLELLGANLNHEG